MIELIDVTHHYGVKPVLKRINLRIEPGEVVVIIGPNGMGKSTLLGVMGGLMAPYKGIVKIDGRIRRGSIEDEVAIDTGPSLKSWRLTGQHQITTAGSKMTAEFVKVG